MPTVTPYDRLKLRPYSDYIRAQLREIQPLQGCIIQFSSDWRPDHSWYRVQGFNMGRAYAVRQHKGRVYVFRLE